MISFEVGIPSLEVRSLFGIRLTQRPDVSSAALVER